MGYLGVSPRDAAVHTGYVIWRALLTSHACVHKRRKAWNLQKEAAAIVGAVSSRKTPDRKLTASSATEADASRQGHFAVHGSFAENPGDRCYDRYALSTVMFALGDVHETPSCRNARSAVFGATGDC
jgi:hypothetical protein